MHVDQAQVLAQWACGLGWTGRECVCVRCADVTAARCLHDVHGQGFEQQQRSDEPAADGLCRPDVAPTPVSVDCVCLWGLFLLLLL